MALATCNHGQPRSKGARVRNLAYESESARLKDGQEFGTLEIARATVLEDASETAVVGESAILLYRDIDVQKSAPFPA